VLEAELQAPCKNRYECMSGAKPQIVGGLPEATGSFIGSQAQDGVALLYLEQTEFDPLFEEAANLLTNASEQDVQEAQDTTVKTARHGYQGPDDLGTCHAQRTSPRASATTTARWPLVPKIVANIMVSTVASGDASGVEALIKNLLELSLRHYALDAVVSGGGPRPRGRGDRVLAAGRNRGAARRSTRLRVYSDGGRGFAPFLDCLVRAVVAPCNKREPSVAPAGCFIKDRFLIDLDAKRRTRQGGVTDAIHRNAEGDDSSQSAEALATCQPNVERTLVHLMPRKHGERWVRVIDQAKVDEEVSLPAADRNLVRPGALGLYLARRGRGWQAGRACACRPCPMAERLKSVIRDCLELSPPGAGSRSGPKKSPISGYAAHPPTAVTRSAPAS